MAASPNESFIDHINKIAKNGRSALICAVRANNVAVAKKLIEYGADVNEVDSEGYTLIHRAAANNSVGMVTLILEECKKKFDDMKTAPEKCASSDRSIEAVTVNAVNKIYGLTPVLSEKIAKASLSLDAGSKYLLGGTNVLNDAKRYMDPETCTVTWLTLYPKEYIDILENVCSDINK